MRKAGSGSQPLIDRIDLGLSESVPTTNVCQPGYRSVGEFTRKLFGFDHLANVNVLMIVVVVFMSVYGPDALVGFLGSLTDEKGHIHEPRGDRTQEDCQDR